MAVDYFSNPPPGLDVHESRTASNNAIGILLFVLSALFVGLRVLTRLKFQHAGLELDDFLMMAGLALNAGNLACCLAGGFWGLGKHIYILQPYDMRQISIITFAYVFIYAWSVCVIKFSIIALYRRIFGMTWLGWWCVVLTTGYLITNHIVLPLYTKPLSYYWDQWSDPNGGVVQVDEAKFYLGIGIINLFGDICILAVPVKNVWQLQMNKTQKLAVTAMFLLGSFVCFASLYRIVTIVHLTQTTDISWAKSDVFIWSSVEPSIGIISGCLPTLRPLLTYLLQNVFGFVPSTKGSSPNPSHKLNTLETISKKRTRRISRKDPLGDDTQFTNLGDDDDMDKTVHEAKIVRYSTSNGQNARWRPDDDEMCLTTTTVQGKGASGGHGAVDVESLESRFDRGTIRVDKEFDWGDNK